MSSVWTSNTHVFSDDVTGMPVWLEGEFFGSEVEIELKAREIKIGLLEPG